MPTLFLPAFPSFYAGPERAQFPRKSGLDGFKHAPGYPVGIIHCFQRGTDRGYYGGDRRETSLFAVIERHIDQLFVRVFPRFREDQFRPLELLIDGSKGNHAFPIAGIPFIPFPEHIGKGLPHLEPQRPKKNNAVFGRSKAVEPSCNIQIPKPFVNFSRLLIVQQSIVIKAGIGFSC